MVRPNPEDVVMRTLLTVVALVGLAGYATLPAVAQEKAGGLADRLQDLNLTDDQEAKIADIRKEYRPKVQEAAKELGALVKEEMDKARAILSDDQKTKLAAIKDERQEFRAERLAERIAHLEQLDLTDAEVAKIAEIRKEFRPQIAKAMEGLKGLLSDEQRKAREEGLKASKKRREILASLNLTDEQKAKVEAVGKEVRTLVREELEKMRDVLSEGQKELLQEFKQERKDRVRDRKAHAIAELKELNLTAEQKAQLADIRKEYRPKVHEAGNKLRGTVREEVEAVVAVLKG
jgi:Spy/CpxP family protein refolding chaperone